MIYPQKILMPNRLFWCFFMESSWKTDNFDKLRNRKQILMKSKTFLRKYGPFVHEPGMWWNLDILGFTPKQILTPNRFFTVFFMEQSWKTDNFDKMNDRKQILMKSKTFFEEVWTICP